MNDDYLIEFNRLNKLGNTVNAHLSLKDTIQRLHSKNTTNIKDFKISGNDVENHDIKLTELAHSKNLKDVISLLKCSNLNHSDLNKLSSVILQNLKKGSSTALREKNDLSDDIIERVRIDKKGFDPNFKERSSTMSDILRYNSRSLKSDYKYDGDLSGNYVKRTPEIHKNFKIHSFFNDPCEQQDSSSKNEILKESSNKTSSSGVYTESISSSSDDQSDSNAFEIIRVIEDSTFGSSTMSIDTRLDNNHEFGKSYNNFDKDYTSMSEHYRSYESTSLNDSLNKSAYSWLQTNTTFCTCSECYPNGFSTVSDISVVTDSSNNSINSYEYQKIDDSFTNSSLDYHCDLDNPCLYCIKRRKKEFSKRYKSMSRK